MTALLAAPARAPGRDEAGGEPAKVERSLLTCFLTVRAVHVAQGVICLVSGWRSYRHPRLAAACLATAVAESLALGARGRRKGRHDAMAARADVALGVVGLAVMSAATDIEDRTGSMNWMLPYTVGAAAGASLGLPTPPAVAAVGLLSLTYAATVTPAARSGAGRLAAAVANTISYGGFYGVTDVFARLLRGAAAEVERASAEAIEQASRLASEQERVRQHRLLHDSALQALEAMAAGFAFDRGQLRNIAREEAGRLRLALAEGDGHTTRLVVALRQAAVEAERSGLRVQLSCESDVEAGPAVALALAEATAEALRNVAKHAGARRAVVRCAKEPGGLEVVVRDHGSGFDPDLVLPGFGIRQSIQARVEEAGGRASVWSAPGQGTRVRMWVPG